MYPPPRSTARAMSSAATSARTNPVRSNNDREEMPERRQSTTDPAMPTQRAIQDSESDLSGSQSMDDRSAEQARETQRLNQIIQQFFVKGALTVVSSRLSLPPFRNRSGAVKQNKWFNLVLDDSEQLNRQTSRWRALDIETGVPKTMTIEVYLDLSELTKGKSLVLQDESGKRWDVLDSIPSPRRGIPNSDGAVDERPLVVERWQFSMEDIASMDSRPDADMLSNVYKKGIPIFRSLYSQARLLPAWKYYRTIMRQSSSSPASQQLKLKYRILSGQLPAVRNDSLETVLYPHQKNVLDRFSFGPLQCPAGILHASVVFRSNCDFRLDDSEALLSSHFMRSGDDYFRPSWTGRTASDSNQIAGSAPASKKGLQLDDEEQGQAYGSLSTFHTTGPKPSSSPISALRAVTDAGSPSSPPIKMLPSQRQDNSSRSSLRSNDGMHQRRPSVSFQPFKAGSLASSPASGMHIASSPLSQSNRPAAMSHRSRPSMTTLPQAILRAPNLQNDLAVASSTSSSPKPAPIAKFSSSFNYRKSRMSSGASREEDRSSGKPSPSSSTRVGSDVLNDGRGEGSGSTQQTDDENLQDFLKLLEAKKELKSFTKNDSTSRDNAMRRTTAALSKYQRMKDSNAVLSDSLSSSLVLNRSSSSSSRQIDKVPTMIPGTSISPGSSIGKPISPHTPHYPPIPSRLSANSIADYSTPRRSRQSTRERSRDPPADEATTETAHDTDHGTYPIAIPHSPQPWTFRRSISSTRHQRSTTEDQIEYGPHRPYSLPDDRELSLADLATDRPSLDQTASDEKIDDPNQSLNQSSEDPSPAESGPDLQPRVYSTTADPSSHGLFTRRSRGSLSRRTTPSLGQSYSPSSSSQVDPQRSQTAERGGSARGPSGRNSTTLGEEENLIFELSDMDSRRSLEEGGSFRGGRGGAGWR
ncbi:hypothetical protein BT63DRAFT_233766 [Microthyrium microscopicum]|uniref:Autophagy-related protein 13 n=1 Tax=Microthyrium microscopicum TaxID=703497 RepID=A0A6A6UDE7_9PEZI|nr:hypothetical protein BT63DRAFT_233766 [Microthyrium microscopicum]